MKTRELMRRLFPSSAMLALSTGLLLFFPWASSDLTADIYRVYREDGSVFYTNRPPAQEMKREVVVDLPSTGTDVGDRPAGWRGREYLPQIENISEDFGLDPQLVVSVIEVESGFNPYAVSPKGACGLMQLMPETAERLGVRDAFDPQQNLEGGIRYLSYLLDLFSGDLRLALAAYNAGENLVMRIGRVPNYRETLHYVDRVIRLYLGPEAPEEEALVLSLGPRRVRSERNPETIRLTNILN